MKRKRKISLFALVLVILHCYNLTVFAEEYPKIAGEGFCSSYIIITGESNVNSFIFSYKTDFPEKTEKRSEGAGNDFVDFKIPVNRFIPGNPRMYKDFLSLLKANDFPYITIEFQGVGLKSEGEPFSYPEHVMVTIAGITRDYTVKLARMDCRNSLFIRGVQTIKLSDFDLVPPTKLNGIIRVRDEINIDFGFIYNFTGQPNISSAK